MRKYCLYDLNARRHIERMYSQGDRIEDIAHFLGVSQSGLRCELRRGYTGELDENQRPGYSAEIGQRVTMQNVRRRGRRRTAEADV